jgi:hypothetical protein
VQNFQSLYPQVVSNLSPYVPGEGSLDETDTNSFIVHAQNLLGQALGQTLLAQAAMQKRLESVEHQVQSVATQSESVDRRVSSLMNQVRELASNSDLITVVQLEVMLNVHWDESEKQRVGVSLSRYSRQKGKPPRKVPHPTLAGGVNGYEPSIVKAWIEDESDFRVPDVLRYVP